MGTLLGNSSKEPKTEKGNRLYEFRRVQSEELQQYCIPVYGYLLSVTALSICQQKFLRNGQIFILRGDKTYNLQGQLVNQ